MQHNKWCLFSCSFFMFFSCWVRLTKNCITAADYWFFFLLSSFFKLISFLASCFVSRSSSFFLDFFGYFFFHFCCKRLVNIGETQRVCEISNSIQGSRWFYLRTIPARACCNKKSKSSVPSVLIGLVELASMYPLFLMPPESVKKKISSGFERKQYKNLFWCLNEYRAVKSMLTRNFCIIN